MRHLIIILTILLLTGFTFVDKQNKNEQKFKIEISYIGLPSPITTKYSIDSERILVHQTLYDSKTDTFVDFNKSTYKKFDKEKIVSFLKNTDWGKIQPKLVTPTIDGYHYTIKLEIENRKFDFDIENTYQPTFDSLFAICNGLIPKNKQRQYNLPYSVGRK